MKSTGYRLGLAAVMTLSGCSSEAVPGDDPSAADANSSEVQVGERVDPAGVVYQLNPNRRDVTTAETDPGDGLGVSRAALVTSGTDAANKVTIQIRSCQSTVTARQQHVMCEIDSEYVVVGGGARTVDEGGAGALLTETRPYSDQLNLWQASSQDVTTASSHHLEVFVIGMRLTGVTRQALLSQMQVKQQSSVLAPAPTVSAEVDANHVLVGGGAAVTTLGVGNLLARSSPAGDARTWTAASTDQGAGSPGALTAFAIGINPVIPGFGELEFVTALSKGMPTAASSPGSATAALGTGWLPTCPGAWASWPVASTVGRVLTGVTPSLSNAVVSDRAHRSPLAGTLTASLRAVRFKSSVTTAPPSKAPGNTVGTGGTSGSGGSGSTTEAPGKPSNGGSAGAGGSGSTTEAPGKPSNGGSAGAGGSGSTTQAAGKPSTGGSAGTGGSGSNSEVPGKPGAGTGGSGSTTQAPGKPSTGTGGSGSTTEAPGKKG